MAQPATAATLQLHQLQGIFFAKSAFLTVFACSVSR
jgi:hypothetical protein